jgi:hypothetical protein
MRFFASLSLPRSTILYAGVILSEDAPAGPRGPVLPAAGCCSASQTKDPVSSRITRSIDRVSARISSWLSLAALVLLVLPLAHAADAGVSVKLNADNAGPHEMQDTTRTSITKAYARAWESMAKALSENNTGALDAAFLSTARDNLAQRVADQKALGMTTRLVDRGHKVDVLFYSPEGMSMQLRDTAQLVWQVLDGSKVVQSQNVTQHYIVVMTPTEVTWKVRVLQEAP